MVKSSGNVDRALQLPDNCTEDVLSSGATETSSYKVDAQGRPLEAILLASVHHPNIVETYAVINLKVVAVAMPF
jgi:hypothetical protein